MFYRQLRRGVNDYNYRLVPADQSQVGLCLENPRQDFYTSLYKYSQSQYDEFQKTDSIKGVTDVVTDWLVFDFDAKENPELAQKDAQRIVERLKTYNVPESAIRISFSGNKGFHVEVRLTENLTVDEFKAITKQFAGDLPTFDKLICDHARPFRVLGSFHPKSCLYKIPLTLNDLNTKTIDEIRDSALDQDDFKGEPWAWINIPLPASLSALKSFKEDYKPKVQQIEVGEINWAMKPKWLTNCRYSLQNGYFGEGMRNTTFTCLAATMKNQGFNEAHTYRYLKGVAECQSLVNECDRYPDSDLWNKIILQVYSDGWKGGQYSCKDKGSLLHEYCLSLGDHKCESKGIDGTVTTSQVLSLFKNYADNYEQNILYSGISNLDKKMKFMVGTSNGVLAPPGVGKTSLCLQILEHNSLNDVPCLFYSYDMFHSALYMRMLQRESGKDQDYLYEMFKKDHTQVQNIIDGLDTKFKNVQFCFKAGQTIDELEQTIDDTEVKLGRKPKLVIVDYNELVQTDVSDPTASSATVAQRLRQIANEKGVCIITLLQPAKQYCSPGDEMTNFNSVKGSSAIVQSLTLLLGCSRPGFNPLNPKTDKFFNITCLKNRNGPLFTLDLSWEGLRGKIDNLEQHEQSELNDLRAKKADQKNEENGGWG